ncbi:PREDICTED: uncharacterized protein LOC109587174 [Amphimedon queenslandica]|uniref:Uncharacterized protein n=1 Tax=Amphimedon queenslandica TaxID=400682 RepID=A0AAN0JPM0_AMPQE|nr:PREDICTED: uncharacterized protein LOC109587174 [Amphimedon queenslandica]|eukprot:XP_019858969.1 PREDICTED: uncharacterized protein LOC109587174 [Amphimedon queenslandica]
MHLNSTTVQMNWLLIPGASYYTIYYSSGCDVDSMSVSNETNEVIIPELYSCLSYSFEISMTIEINEIYYEGPRTAPTVIELPTVEVELSSYSYTEAISTSSPTSASSDECTNTSTLYIFLPILGISLFINMILVCVVIVMCCKKKIVYSVKSIKLKNNVEHDYAVLDPPVVQNPQDAIYESPLDLASLEPPQNDYTVEAEQEN